MKKIIILSCIITLCLSLPAFAVKYDESYIPDNASSVTIVKKSKNKTKTIKITRKKVYMPTGRSIDQIPTGNQTPSEDQTYDPSSWYR